MGFRDIVKKSILQGIASSDISVSKIVLTLGICFLFAIYIFFVYRYVTKNTFYDRNFNVTMAVISIIVAGILLAMQSNLVISLGMVGALSIVRFRTAIKEPMDLLFLFWSIGTGIMCGAGLYSLTIIVALMVTVGILVLQIIPINVCPYLIIVNTKNKEAEDNILNIVKRYSPRYKIDSKNIRLTGMDMIVEVRTKNGNKLVDEISKLEDVLTVSLLYHDSPVKS